MRSLRAKILTIVLIFLSFTGTAFVFYSIITTMNYKKLRLEGIKKTVEFETEKVNKTILGFERSAIYFALNGLLFYRSESKEINETLVLEYLRSFTSILGGGYWFEPYAYNNDTLRAGVYAFIDKDNGKMHLSDDSIMASFDYHNASWYREIIEEIKKPYQVVWTKPYIDDAEPHSLITTAGAGIFDRSGSLLGISTVDLKIEKIIEELTAIKPTENSFVLLCVPKQDYIISSTLASSDVGKSMSSLTWDITADSFTHQGETYLKFDRYMDNDWFLSIQIPEDEIFAEVEKQNNRFSLIIIFSSVLALCLAYYLISKFINAPIKRLTSEVEQITLGNLDTRIEITSQDELGMLADAFNKMAADLNSSIEANAREHSEQERMRAELRVATEIQASMLPCNFPPYPDRTEFDIYATMLPAKEVGGDFYDFYFADEDNLVVVIADVSGKGVPAALFMVITKTLIKNCSSCKSPKGVLETVNKKLCGYNDTDMFVTAIIGFYNVVSGKMIYVNAGHNPPLIKKDGGDYEFLKTKPNLILAWDKNVEYVEEEITLKPGDTLYFYTDGVTEAMNDSRELFSEKRLIHALNTYKDYPPDKLLPAIKDEIDTFVDGAEQADDIAMLALKIKSTPNLLENHMKTLIIEARVDNLDKVLDFVNEALEQHNCPPDLQSQIDIVVEEIFVNIAHYAYEPEKGNVAISIATGEKFVAVFDDTGKPYNPIEHTVPDLNVPLSERKMGGLGILLVKQLMDEVTYAHVDNRNVLIISKRIKK